MASDPFSSMSTSTPASFFLLRQDPKNFFDVSLKLEWRAAVSPVGEDGGSFAADFWCLVACLVLAGFSCPDDLEVADSTTLEGPSSRLAPDEPSNGGSSRAARGFVWSESSIRSLSVSPIFRANQAGSLAFIFWDGILESSAPTRPEVLHSFFECVQNGILEWVQNVGGFACPLVDNNHDTED